MVAADIAVVGGGPAGAAAAITLARAGRDVVLVDRARFPRDKCCGDGLTTGALRRLEELGLPPGAVASWTPVHEVWVRSPSGRTVGFPFPRGQGTFAAVARRSDLDAALLDVARAAGVKVHDGHALQGASWQAGGAVVELDVAGIGTVVARYAVGADGMWSPLRKALGSDGEPGYLGEWHAFRQYFTGVSDAAASQLWVWFEPDLLPGYAWSFPLGAGRSNVGFGIQRAGAAPTRSMAEQWRDLLQRPHLRAVLGEDAKPEAPHKAWPIPARLERTSLAGAGGRVLFAGDAARGTDPMTGEGIGQALEMGVLAGRSILAGGGRDPERAAATYERAVRSGLGVDNRLAGLLSRHGIAHRKGVRSALWLAGTTGWTRRNFARWLFEDYPRALVATPHRWERGMLSRAGAYR
ncbi:MAG TPA: geranylgeranyl reductase family protein [Acidimicrobiales bacterium]|nr:geranylgeranyl reductase family protein [Acidimicrobiales bacterium]